MRYFLTLFLSFCCASSALAQSNLDWSQSYGTTGDQRSMDVQWANNGDLLSVGNFEGTTVFGPGSDQTLTAIGASDGYIMRQDEAGLTSWVFTWGGTGIDLGAACVEDDMGDIYVVGSFSDSLILGSDTLVSKGNTDGITIKLDASGNLIWHHVVGSIVEDVGYDIALTQANDPIVLYEYRIAAYFGTDSLISNGSRDAGLVKMTPSGGVQWTRSIGGVGPSDYPKAVNLDAAGNIFLYGSFRDTVDFDNGPDTAERTAFGTDVYLLKLNPNGDFLWVQVMGQVSEDAAYDAYLRDDYILLTGLFKGFIDVQGIGGDSLFLSNGHYDGFLIKVSITGQFQWAKTFGNTGFDQGCSVTANADGDVFFSGFFTEECDIDTGPEVQIATGNPSTRTMFLQRYNSSGNMMWASELVSQGDAYPEGIALRDDGLLAMSGRTIGNTDLALFEEQDVLQTTLGSFNAFNVVYRPCEDQLDSIAVERCDAYVFNGVSYDSTGVYLDTVETFTGCRTITQINLLIYPDIPETSVNESSCDSLVYEGITYFESTDFSQTLSSVNGCDSIVNISLQVGQSTSYVSTVESCGPYDFNGVIYEESGTYLQEFQNGLGCDSILELSLTVINIDSTVTVDGAILISEQTGAIYQWLDCDDGLSPIDGATESSYIATEVGNYAVLVELGSCSATSDCLPITTIGLTEASDLGISIYPNPASDYTLIDGLSANTVLRIYDSLGRQVWVQQHTTGQLLLKLDRLDSGRYQLAFETDSGFAISSLFVD